jgi:hypothetical protein
MAHSLRHPFHMIPATTNPAAKRVHTTLTLVQVFQVLPALVPVDVAYAMEGSKIPMLLSLIHLSSMRCMRRDAPGNKEPLSWVQAAQALIYFRLLASPVVTHMR